MSDKEFFNSEGSIFYQVFPDDPPQYLGCSQISGMQLSGREPGSPVQCPDPGKRGAFKNRRVLPGGKIDPTFQMSRPLRERNYLNMLRGKGPINLRVNFAQYGAETDIENYDVAYIWTQAHMGGPALDGSKPLQSGDVARMAMNVSAVGVYGFELKKLDSSRQTTTEDQLGNGVFFFSAIDGGLMARDAGEYGVITADAAAAAEANVLLTTDYGATWTAAAATPLTDGTFENIGFPLGVDLPQTLSKRVIVFRTETQAAENPVAVYSDDWGATWTEVELMGGTVGYDAEFVTAAIKVHDGLILAGTDQGEVIYSTDKGASWTLGAYGGANDVRAFAVSPVDGKIWAVGDGNDFYYSEDNGKTWTSAGSLTGDGGGVAVNYAGYVFVIDGTDLKFTKTEDDTFTTVSIPGTVTSLNDLKEDPDYSHILYLLVDDAGSDDVLYRSEDGGVSWVAQDTSGSNTGLNACHVVNANLLWVVGDVVSTTWIEKVFGSGEGANL